MQWRKIKENIYGEITLVYQGYLLASSSPGQPIRQRKESLPKAPHYLRQALP